MISKPFTMAEVTVLEDGTAEELRAVARKYLKTFLRRWIAWSAAGEHPFFSRRHGLCMALVGMLREDSKYQIFEPAGIRIVFSELLAKYPLRVTLAAYTEDHKNCNAHRNRVRVHWVKLVLKEVLK